MPDISMCANSTCSKRMQCHRFTAEPCEYRQSYATFKPQPGFDYCDHFWDNAGYKKAGDDDVQA